MKKKKKTPRRAATQSKSRRKGAGGKTAVEDTAQKYWSALVRAGYLQGTPGSQIINPNVGLLLDAAYEVLAGGTLSGTVPGDLTVSAGLASEVARFKKLRDARLAAINAAGGPGFLKMKTG